MRCVEAALAGVGDLTEGAWGCEPVLAYEQQLGQAGQHMPRLLLLADACLWELARVKQQLLEGQRAVEGRQQAERAAQERQQVGCLRRVLLSGCLLA